MSPPVCCCELARVAGAGAGPDPGVAAKSRVAGTAPLTSFAPGAVDMALLFRVTSREMVGPLWFLFGVSVSERQEARRAWRDYRKEASESRVVDYSTKEEKTERSIETPDLN